MTLAYLSPHSNVSKALVHPQAIILGPSKVGEGSYVDANVILGYPVRRKLRDAASQSPTSRGEEVYRLLDRVSEGATLGKHVVVRSGSVVYENAVLGDNVETGHNVLIREETRIGPNTIVGTGTIIDGRVEIGAGVRIESGVYIPPYTRVGNNVFLGPRAVLTNDRYPPSKRLQGPTLEDNVSVGANAVILPGVRIGRGAVVAAGSVVTRDVPENAVVAGVPARVVGDRRGFEAKKVLWERAEG